MVGYAEMRVFKIIVSYVSIVTSHHPYTGAVEAKCSQTLQTNTHAHTHIE